MDGQDVLEQRLNVFLRQRLNQKTTINAMMDMRLVSFDRVQRTVVLAFPVAAWQLNPAGNLHGGMLSTAIDITMGCIAYITSQAGFTPTVQMAVNYNASVKCDSTLLVEGICDHCGSRLVQTRAIAKCEGSTKIVATANGSYAVNTGR